MSYSSKRVNCEACSQLRYHTSISDIFYRRCRIMPIISYLPGWSYFCSLVSLRVGRLLPINPKSRNYHVELRILAPIVSFSSSLNLMVMRRQPECNHSYHSGLQSLRKQKILVSISRDEGYLMDVQYPKNSLTLVNEPTQRSNYQLPQDPLNIIYPYPFPQLATVDYWPGSCPFSCSR